MSTRQESESNDSYNHADPLALDTVTIGQLSSNKDIDFYRITVPDSGSLNVLLDSQSTTSYPKNFLLGVYNSSGTLQSRVSVSPNGNYEVGVNEGGDYYLSLGASGYHYNSDPYHLTTTYTANPEVRFENESNDRFLTANNIDLDTSISGQLSSHDDTDFYRLSDLSEGIVSIAFDSPTDSSNYEYFRVGLYNSAGTLLGLYSTGEDGNYEFSLEADGDYYVGITSRGSGSYGYDSNTYNLTATHSSSTETHWEHESNDSLINADELILDVPITGQLSSGSDLDFYRLTLSNAGSIAVDFNVPTDHSRTDFFQLGLYDSNGNLLGKHDTGLDTTFQFGIAEAGDYYLRVSTDLGIHYDFNNYSLTATYSEGTESNFEHEKNDTFNNANELTLGSAISGQLSSENDLDFYRLSISNPGSITIDFGTPNLQLGLYDSNGTLLGAHSTGQDSGHQFGIAEAGEYYLRVSAHPAMYSYNSEVYSLIATYSEGTENSFEYEQNGAFYSANDLALESTISGQLSSQDDLDFYRLSISNAGSITVNFDVPTDISYLDKFQLGLYDSNGILLAEYGTGQDSSFQFGVAKAGDYFLKVSTNQGRSFNSNTYNLSVTHSEESVASVEYEHNGTINNANELTLGSTVSGQLSSVSDLDFYRLSNLNAGSIAIAFDAPTDTSYYERFQLKLYDSNGILLGQFSTSKDSNYHFGIAETGDYFLRVSAEKDRYEPSPYSLTITHSEELETNVENEQNGTFNDANELTLDSTISGWLSSKDDLDFYKLSLTAAGSITVDFNLLTGESHSESFRLGLYKSDGTLLGEYSTGQASNSYQFGIAKSGSYYLGVSGGSYDSNAYNLTASFSEGSENGFEYEHNGILNNANELALGSAISGQLSSRDDLDFYRLSIASPGSIAVDFDVPTDTYVEYFQLGLYDNNGTLLKEYSTGQDHSYQFSAAEAGDFFLGISSDRTNHDSNAYSLTATHSEESGTDSVNELDTNFDNATALALGSNISGQISSRDDIHFYHLSIHSAGSIAIDFDVLWDSYFDDFRLYLYDHNGNLLGRHSTGQDRIYQFGVAEPGDYFLGIEGRSSSAESYNLTASHLEGTEANFEHEQNGNLYNANELALGSKISGQLSSGYDLDFYHLPITGAGSITVVFEGPAKNANIITSTEYFELGLYDSDGSLLAKYRVGDVSSYQFTIVEAGDYYLGVNADGHKSTLYDSDTYSLTATYSEETGTHSEQEQNGTVNTANELIFGSSITGQLSSEGDLDFYRLSIANTGGLTIAFDAPTNSPNSEHFDLGLYDSSGSLLGQYSTGQDSSYQFGIAAAGDYFFKVSSGGSSLDSNPYSLTATYTNETSVEYEQNDTFHNANALALDSTISGQLSSEDDLDFYRLSISNAGNITVAFDVPTDSSYTEYFQLGLYDSNGTLLGEYSTGLDKSYQFGIAEAGDYYLKIGTNQGVFYDPTPYSLTTTYSEGTEASFEYEQNDTFDSSNDLVLGSSISGQLSSRNDLDFYRLAITSAGSISVDFDVPTDDRYSEYFTLGLYDSDGILLGDYHTGKDNSYQFGIKEAGVYYLRVSPYSWDYDSNAYSLTATYSDEAATSYEHEQNGTFDNANELTLGLTTSGQLSSGYDLDFYHLSISNAGIITVDFDVPTDIYHSEYFELRLYDSNGTLLRKYSTGQDNSYQFGVAEAGDYFLRVSTAQERYYDSNAYNLTATYSEGGHNSFEHEQNGSFDNANVLALDSEISGQLLSADDLDFYRLPISSAGSIAVNLDVPTDSDYYKYFTLELYDSSGTSLGRYNTGQDDSYQFGITEAGSYYVGISNNRDTAFNSGIYNLSVIHDEIDQRNDFEHESNDTFHYADELTDGIPLTGWLSSLEDVDVYSFDVDSAGHISLVLDAPTSSNFLLSIHTSTGKLLSSFKAREEDTYEIGVAEAGKYYITMAAISQTDAYSLSATHTSDSQSNFEHESNNTFIEANKLEHDAYVTGQLLSLEDVDLYRIEVPHPGIANLALDFTTDSYRSTPFQVDLYNSRGVLLSSLTPSRNESYQLILPKAGEYFVGLSSTASYSSSLVTDSYNLTLDYDIVLADRAVDFFEFQYVTEDKVLLDTGYNEGTIIFDYQDARDARFIFTMQGDDVIHIEDNHSPGDSIEDTLFLSGGTGNDTYVAGPGADSIAIFDMEGDNDSFYLDKSFHGAELSLYGLIEDKHLFVATSDGWELIFLNYNDPEHKIENFYLKTYSRENHYHYSFNDFISLLKHSDDWIGNLTLEDLEQADSPFHTVIEELELYSELVEKDAYEIYEIQQNHDPDRDIHGKAEQGQTLTVNSRLTDDLNTPEYQWMRNGEIIEGKTSNSYVLTAADINASITAMINYIDDAGIAAQIISDSLGDISAYTKVISDVINAKSSSFAVQAAYIAYYGRPADPGGLAAWAELMEQSGGELSSIIEAFGTSQEFEERYGDLSSTELVNEIYVQLFNRPAEEAGLNAWSAFLDDGVKTLQSIALDILLGARNSDALSIQKKIEFADVFTEQVDTGVLGYSGSDHANTIKSIFFDVGAETNANTFDGLISSYAQQITQQDEISPLPHFVNNSPEDLIFTLPQTNAGEDVILTGSSEYDYQQAESLF